MPPPSLSLAKVEMPSGYCRIARKRFPSNSTFPSMQAELYAQTNRMQDAIRIYQLILRTDSLEF